MILLSGVMLLALGACASPQQRLHQVAEGVGLHALTLEGQHFQHIAYRNTRPIEGILHVYLDGDGSPWQGSRVMRDPTPRRPLVLQLMAQDTQASLYLGRPCYHGLHSAPGCSPWLWTAARYSPAVVASLVAALDTMLSTQPATELVLIGYSGGGTLAMLMAPHLPQTRMIITIAANLDTAAWTQHHGYSPLLGSLNPAEHVPLAVAQWHLSGEYDITVPPALTEPMIQRQPCARSERLPGFDHRCCWVDYWPQFLSQLRHQPLHCSPSDAASTYVHTR